MSKSLQRKKDTQQNDGETSVLTKKQRSPELPGGAGVQTVNS